MSVKKSYKFISIVLFLLTFVNLSVTNAKASEGYFELENQIGTAARCFAASGLMENREFQILTLCRDILYPGGSEVYTYIAWANPLDGARPTPMKLGELGRGKKLFKTNRPFNTLFVTTELDGRTKTPTGQVIMQGNLKTIDFLGQVPVNSDNPPSTQINELDDQSPSPVASPITDEEGQTNSRNVFRIIALGGVLAFLAIFGVVLIIFVVSRR